MKTKKVNKFKKASSKLAFLFACAIVVSPCITSCEGSEFGASLDTNFNVTSISEGIPGEIISSNNDNEITVARFNKTMKQANRKNIDIINYRLNNFNSTNNTLELSYLVCNAYLNDGADEYYLYNNLTLTYDLTSNSFTYCEFEVEFSHDVGDKYLLDYFTPSIFINILNLYDGSIIAYIDTYTTYDEIGISCSTEDGNVLFERYFSLGGDTFGSIQYFGEKFNVADIIFEVQSIKQLIDFKYQNGYNVGYNVGYNTAYDRGYDVGYSAGQETGFDRGYDEGLQDGYLDGFDEGYAEGYDKGLKEVSDVAYNNGYSKGFEDGKIASGTSYQEGYTKGYQDAKNQYQNVEALSFEDLLTSVITAPSTIIREGFDFDILGINVGSFIQTCIVIGLIVFTIGLFKKG